MMSSSSSSHPKPNNRHHIANRRSEVWSYLCQGMTRQDIATTLRVDASTISRDIEYLTIKSQQYIDDMAKKTLPFMYQKSIEGINEALKECWHIYNQKDAVPPLVRLSALRLVKDCNEALFGLTANGPSVLAVKKIKERANALGIEADNSNSDNNKFMR
jgi:hypothetical protein